MGLFLTSPRAEPSEVIEPISDPRRIAHIFRALTRSKARGHVVGAGDPLGLIARDRVTDPAGRASLRHSLQWMYDGPAWSGSTAVEMGGPLSLYRFSLEIAGQAPGTITTPLPAVVHRMRSRREVRVTAPPGILLRLSGETATPRLLCNVSWNGLAFTVEEGDAFGRAGAIGDAVIEWQGRLRVCVRVHVRHLSDRADGTLVAGGKLTFASPEDAQHWTTEVDALVDPVTRAGGMWTRDLWELFESSGYFALSRKSPADFARLREAFAGSSQKLARAESLGTQIVWPSARGVEASASAVFMNRAAVFLYHLARRSGAPPVGLSGRDLVYAVHARALSWIQQQKDARWLVVWVQDVARFSKRAHLDFIERNADGESACNVTVRALEVAVHPLASEAQRIPSRAGGELGETGWTTREAQRADSAAIAQAARAAFPPSFVDAHALDAPLDLSFPNWDAAALDRGREVLVAERAGRIEAAAILEWTEDGIHFFGLLDVLRLIPMGEAAADAAPALIAHARRSFAHRGKSVFVFACDPGVPESQWPEGSKDLGLTHCTVMSTALVAELAEHAWEVITGAPR